MNRTFLGLVLIFGLSSCTANIYESVADKDSEEHKLEEARTLLDERKYDEAVEILSGMEDDDSNERRMLLAAGFVGLGGLDMFEIIISILEDTVTSGGGTSEEGEPEKGSGIDKFLDAITGDTLGEGDVRVARMASLNSAVQVLNTAPEPSDKRVTNLACILSGILVVPSVLDAKDAVATVKSALDSVSATASSGGTVCPAIGAFNTAAEALPGIVSNFQAILAGTAACPFLDFSETAEDLNVVEEQMQRLTTNADKGCQTLPTCPAGVPQCNDIFPTCVQDELDIGSANPAASDDGLIASCEIVLHCSSGSACFQ